MIDSNPLWWAGKVWDQMTDSNPLWRVGDPDPPIAPHLACRWTRSFSTTPGSGVYLSCSPRAANTTTTSRPLRASKRLGVGAAPSAPWTLPAAALPFFLAAAGAVKSAVIMTSKSSGGMGTLRRINASMAAGYRLGVGSEAAPSRWGDRAFRSSRAEYVDGT